MYIATLRVYIRISVMRTDYFGTHAHSVSFNDLKATNCITLYYYSKHTHSTRMY